MKSLNKRHMMFAITVSLVAYAIAMAGCGAKKSPDTDTKAANLEATKVLAGTWASDTQTTKPGQQNLYLLTITKTKMTLRLACAIDQKDRTAPVNATAETENDFSVDAKSIKFEGTQTKKSGEAPDDCAVSLAKGNVKFSIEGDKLTLGINSDGTATSDPKATGIVFKKATTDQLQSFEKDMFAKSPAGIAAAAVKAADPAAAAAKDLAQKVDGPSIAGLVGTWFLQIEDTKVKATLGLSKTNYDYIRFSDKQNKFVERYVCRYQLLTKDKTTNTILPPIEIGFRMKTDHLPDTSEDLNQQAISDLDKRGIQFEAVPKEMAIKITDSPGTGVAKALFPDTIKLTDKDEMTTDCQLSYSQNQKLSYDLSKDGNTLGLFDETNKDSRREFHKFDPKNAADVEIAKVIKRNTKEDKPATVAKKDDKAKDKDADDGDDDENDAKLQAAVDAATAADAKKTTNAPSIKPSEVVVPAAVGADKAPVKGENTAAKGVVAPTAAAVETGASKNMNSAAAAMQRSASKVPATTVNPAAVTPVAPAPAASNPTLAKPAAAPASGGAIPTATVPANTSGNTDKQALHAGGL